MGGNLIAGFALGFAFLGTACDASAIGDRRTCEHCGAASTTRYYKTIHPLLYVTRYHDRSVYHHVTRLHYVVDVTRIQPIIHVQDVTRIHHYTIVRDAYASQPQVLAPEPYVPQTPVYAAGCGCVD